MADLEEGAASLLLYSGEQYLMVEAQEPVGLFLRPPVAHARFVDARPLKSPAVTSFDKPSNIPFEYISKGYAR